VVCLILTAGVFTCSDRSFGDEHRFQQRMNWYGVPVAGRVAAPPNVTRRLVVRSDDIGSLSPSATAGDDGGLDAGPLSVVGMNVGFRNAEPTFHLLYPSNEPP
jgi:hypothetical protein